MHSLVHIDAAAGLVNATDVLAAVSALGWIQEGELGRLGSELRVPRNDAARLLGRHFQHQPAIRSLLRPQVIGTDTQWIGQLLDANEVSPDEVLDCYNGTQLEAPVAGLAKLLVPRGTDPTHIANLRLRVAVGKLGFR